MIDAPEVFSFEENVELNEEFFNVTEKFEIYEKSL